MKTLWQLLLTLALGLTVCFAEDVVSVVHGTVTKIDKDTKTVVIKATDGTEHTIKATDHAVVHGTEKGFDDLKEGSKVVARYTKSGADKTADELGKIGDDAMKPTKGTITKVDKDGKTVTVKAADGTEKTFEYTETATKDLGKETGRGLEKGAHATVYYTEESGKKVAHFFEKW